MGEEVLVVKKKRDRIAIKVVDKRINSWTPSRYEKVIPNKDYHQLSYLFYDLRNMGYPIEKAFEEFKHFLNKPDLFFLN